MKETKTSAEKVVKDPKPKLMNIYRRIQGRESSRMVSTDEQH